jgi:AhpD family alkylhydroperoxidase
LTGKFPVPYPRDGHEAVRLAAFFTPNPRGWGDVSHHEFLVQQRIDVTKVSPAAFQAVAALQSYVDQSGLDPKLRELIKIRASQINGCAYCLAMHTRDARKHGETDERMHLLNAWRETPLYSARERAALAWAEAITLLTEGHVPDDVFETVRKQFSEKEIVDLTAAAVAINTWNRLSIAFRVPPQVDTKKAAA